MQPAMCSTLHDAYDQQAAATPDAIAVIGWGKHRFQLTYGEVSSKSKALASTLSKLRSREDGRTTASVDRTVLAIHHSREDPDFLPTLLAASRCGQRFVLLSRDLTDEKLQRSRNDFVLHTLRPWLVIGGEINGEAHRVVPRLDEPQGTLLNGDDHCVAPAPADPLCFIFTGGTVRTKIVEVTHRMFLHERSSYWELWTPRRHPMVLAHTSVYWAASALGQLSIALAYGGTAVLTQATDVSKLQQCIVEEQINVLGVVPEHLDLLARRPKEDLPNIDLVFTWGERLAPQLAQRWRGHGASIRELLVSSEYWLTCWADPLDDGLLRSVRAAKILILTEQGTEAAEGELGLLCIGGPMVMAGYHQNARVAAPADVFLQRGDQRFFRTSDLVRRERGGIVFKGRADMMAKSGGKWVDMMAVEDAINGIPGVRAGKILPDTATEQFHSFVALSGEGMRPDCVLDNVRQKLPPRVQLWLLADLPRHPVTRKIDLAQLSRIIQAPPASWPLENGETSEMYKSRLRETIESQVLWTLAALGVSYVCGCPVSELSRQLGLAAAWLATLRFLSGLPKTAPIPRIAATILWLAVVPRREKSALLRWVCSASTLTFTYLALTYADDARINSQPFGVWLFRVVDELPLWKFGFFVWASLLRHAPAPIGWVAGATLAAAAASGAYLAGSRGRLLAWPTLFWSSGIGHQLEMDIRNWMHLTMWRDHALKLLDSCKESLLSCWPFQPASVEPPAEERPAEAEAEPQKCTTCGEEAGRYPLPLPRRKVLCEGCTRTFAEDAETKVATFVEGASAGLAEPLAKRPRLDPGDGGEVSYLQRIQAAAGQPDVSADIEAVQKWWWYHHVCDEIHALPTPAGWEEDQQQCMDPCTNLTEEEKQLFKALGEVEPLLKPVTPSSVLLGLDSLRIARLANKLRNEFGCMVPAPRIREMRTAAELAQVVAEAPRVAAPKCCVDAEPEDVGREYAIWFSPGQVSPMGQWVLRGDGRLNREALTEATRRLVERHPALRLQIVDPLRYLSFTFDVGVIFTLLGPLMDRCPWPGRLVRKVIARALEKGWPRVRCFSRREIYATRNEAQLPLDIIEITNGQEQFESTLKRRRYNLVPPTQITGYEMLCYLQGTWAYQRWDGKFVIREAPPQLEYADAVSRLIYVDVHTLEFGPLVGPTSSAWERPPYGFPALFFVPLSSGASLWLRLHRADELRVCYLEPRGSSKVRHGLAALRASPRHPEPVVVSFIGVCMLHAFADGNCYLPLVKDLMTGYVAVTENRKPQLAPLEDSLAELQRRLFDTFHGRPTPARCSLRGGIYRFRGRGYGHSIGLFPEAMAALAKVGVQYRLPLDVVLLGLCICATARADDSDTVDMTLYAGMRDGNGEAMAVGLFSDWRDIFVRVDFDYATLVGTLLQLYYKIQNRQWVPYNALRKPERVVVNVQPLDFERHGGLLHVGENMWTGGDQLANPETRDKLAAVHQPLTLVIEQQDEETWWVLLSAAHHLKPTPWMRHWIHAFHESVFDLLQNPSSRVHKPLPTDAELLRLFLQDAIDAGYLAAAEPS